MAKKVPRGATASAATPAPAPASAPPDAFALLAGVQLNANQKARVFISSRMAWQLGGEALRDVRAELKRLLERAHPCLNVELAEQWTAGIKGSPREQSIAGARWCDLMIGVFVAEAGYRDDAGLYATEAELNHALEDSWDKVLFFAHQGLVDTLAAQPPGYRQLVQGVMAYRDGKNVAFFDSKQQLFQAVFDAVAGHLAATVRRYPSRTSGKSTEQAKWELMTFTERHAAIHGAFGQAAGQLQGVGAIVAMARGEARQDHVVYAISIARGRRKPLLLPTIVSVCPDRFSFAEAARFVGYPFRTMTEGWTDPLGPLHIVCVYRGVTDSQIRKHLGNPDIRVAKEAWGYFARDPERAIQSLYLTACEDAPRLRDRLNDALAWLTTTELDALLAGATARGRILAAGR